MLQWICNHPWRTLAVYTFIGWLSGGFAYRRPVMVVGLTGTTEPPIEAFFACVGWPVYWFFRSMTVGV